MCNNLHKFIVTSHSTIIFSFEKNSANFLKKNMERPLLDYTKYFVSQ